MTKILIAEDEPDIQLLLGLILRYTGYQVISATDGQMAYELALAEIPDLVIMDVQMPKLNGYEACKRITAEATLRHTPVMFLSSLSAVADVQAGFAAGGIAYLLKPFALDEFKGAVAEVLGRRPAHDIALSRAAA